MEEKVLIKSKANEQIVKTLKYLAIGCLVGAILIFLIGVMRAANEYEYRTYEFDPFWIDVLFLYSSSWIAYIIFIVGVISAILYFCYTKCELTITEKNIKGKSLFGKEVVLPIYMVSAFSTKMLFSVIAVATSSGFVKFGCIANYKEIGEVLTSLISERQENTRVEGTSSNLDSLKQLKELLDNGIITQEEFETKKKQILGL